MDTATISVISSAIIAILSLTLPLVVNSLNDRAKWKRETKAAELQRIDKATEELLELPSHYRSGQASHAANKPFERIYSELLSKFYVWQRVVWTKLPINDDRLWLINLQHQFEHGQAQFFYDQEPKLADDVLTLSNKASENLK